MQASKGVLFAVSLALLGGCVVAPTAPSVLALPGRGKSFEEFRRDDAECRQYALYQTGGTDMNQAATTSGVTSAAVGTAVGALAGAAIGGHRGVGAGAGAGLLVGSMAGSDAAVRSASRTQRAYDYAYIQCMYAKGERVPVPGNMLPYRGSTYRDRASDAQGYSVPPPPAGYPPAPPPDYSPRR